MFILAYILVHIQIKNLQTLSIIRIMRPLWTYLCSLIAIYFFLMPYWTGNRTFIAQFWTVALCAQASETSEAPLPQLWGSCSHAHDVKRLMSEILLLLKTLRVERLITPTICLHEATHFLKSDVSVCEAAFFSAVFARSGLYTWFMRSGSLMFLLRPQTALKVSFSKLCCPINWWDDDGIVSSRQPGRETVLKLMWR